MSAVVNSYLNKLVAETGSKEDIVKSATVPWCIVAHKSFMLRVYISCNNESRLAGCDAFDEGNVEFATRWVDCGNRNWRGHVT